MSQANLWHNKLSDVDDSAQVPIGAIRSDRYGNEYIYLLGVADVAVGTWVTYKITSRTTGAAVARLVANAVGMVAIAMGAVIAGKFGWFQVFGFTVDAKAISGGDAAVGAILVSTSTDGSVDDVAVAGDYIFGALCTVQEGESPASAGTLGVFLTYPFVTDLSGIHTT